MEIRYVRKLLMFVGVLFFNLSLMAYGESGVDEISIITDSSVPRPSMPMSEVTNIILGYKIQWPDKQPVVLVVCKEESLLQKIAVVFAQKTPSQFMMYWKRKVFTGEGKFPMLVNTEQNVMEYVKSTPGALGFIFSKTKPLEGIQVIKVSN
ncbi:MAG: hypothetical protein HQK77_19545 [Desulfobacterales bacterium]|nr:hypothetical protein [Desulfobacterales bacterium]